MSKNNFPIAKQGTSLSRVLLVASLALNLAILGVVAGASFRKDYALSQSAREIRTQAIRERDFGLGPFIGALDDEARRTVGEAFLTQVGSRETARQTVRLRMQDTLVLLKAHPFDVVAFEKHFSKQQQAFSERQSIGTRALIEYVSQMTELERSQYTERLDDILSLPRRGRERGGSARRDDAPAEHSHPPARQKPQNPSN